MKLIVTKAQTFEIDPTKEYICIVAADEKDWTQEQRDKLTEALKSRNIDLIILPKSGKFKVMEKPHGKNNRS